MFPPQSPGDKLTLTELSWSLQNPRRNTFLAQAVI